MFRLLVAALVLGGAAISSATDAQSQSTTATAGTDKSSANSQTSDVGEIVVTGSRIAVSNGYEQPTPVTVATAADLFKSTPTDLADALNTLPQFDNSSSPSRSTHNFTSSGLNGNLLNLRNLGPDETLILFDGHRVAPTTYLGLVDVDVIPNLLIQRVDIVTGGASAVYGSDAVAGVVNFVLDRNFEGIKGEAQGGIAQEGANGNRRFGLAAGTKLFDDRAHLLVSVEEYHNDGMLRSDRPNAGSSYLYGGANPGSPSPPGSAANPYTIYKNSTLAFASATGQIWGAPFGFGTMQFTPGGTGLVPFNNGTPTGTPGYYSGGDGFSIPSNDTAIAPQEREQVFGRLSYRLTNDVTAYAQATLTRSELDYVSLTNGDEAPGAPVFSGNPYLPASVQSALAASGNSSFGDAIYPLPGPEPTTSEVTDFYMVSLGLEGHFHDDWFWSATYDHGYARENVDQRDLLYDPRFYAALDAVVNPANGQIVCNVSLNPNPAIRNTYSGCVPLNIINPSTTPAGLAYSEGASRYRAVNSQDHVDASVRGNLPGLPAGPVGVAFGAEFRRETLDLTSNSNPALLETTAEQNAFFAGLRGVPAGTLAYYLTNTGVANASENVKEAFAEVNVPILKDKPFAQSFDLNGAGRVTDYSTSGTVETWKGGFTWRPIEDLLVRGTDSRDIRAPTLYELFSGADSGTGQLYDPVTNSTRNVATITSGNPNLKPEVGTTYTFGFVFSPRFVPNFSIAIDYYSIKLTGAVTTLSDQQIVTNCSTIGADCNLVTRPTPTSFPTLITVAPTNSSFLKTSGIDIDASYRANLGDGSLGLRLYANYMQHFITQQSATEPSYENAGYATVGNQPTALPHQRGALNVDYKIHDFDFFLAEQYIGSLSLDSPQPDNVYVNPNIASVFYTNATATYELPMDKLSVETYLTVGNLFNKQPPLVPGSIPGLNLPTIISLYDTVGRTFTLGARFKF